MSGMIWKISKAVMTTIHRVNKMCECSLNDEKLNMRKQTARIWHLVQHMNTASDVHASLSGCSGFKSRLDNFLWMHTLQAAGDGSSPWEPATHVANQGRPLGHCCWPGAHLGVGDHLMTKPDDGYPLHTSSSLFFSFWLSLSLSFDKMKKKIKEMRKRRAFREAVRDWLVNENSVASNCPSCDTLSRSKIQS